VLNLTIIRITSSLLIQVAESYTWTITISQTISPNYQTTSQDGISMRPVLQMTALFSMLAAALLSTGCCGPLMFHGGCQSGCGEMYVDPWINDPAECCDPCDSCGNYNGQSCGSCRPMLSGTKSIWGYRYAGGSGCDGCDSCGGGEVACGLEPSCGFEPGCGFEGCGACADCGGHGHPGHVTGPGQMGYVGHPTPIGDSVIRMSDPLESSRVVVPPNARRTTAARPGGQFRNR